MNVTGPSLTSSTSISAPKRPVSTVRPAARSPSATRRYSASARAGASAGSKLGRLPLARVAQSVNWLITKHAPPTSAAVTSMGVRFGKIRSAAILRAVASASASPSPFSTPTSKTNPRSIFPTTSPPTRTSARVTR